MRISQLIFFCTLIFVLFFYDEHPGFNVGLLGIILSVIVLLDTAPRKRTPLFYGYFAASVLSSLAWSWYGDAASFFALAVSLLFLRLKSRNSHLRESMVIPIAFLSGLTFLYRIFLFDQWLPTVDAGARVRRGIALVVLPAFFLLVFFIAYSLGSDTFAAVWSELRWDINIWEFLLLAALGFFLSFNFWNFFVSKNIIRLNAAMTDRFGHKLPVAKPTYSFLDVETERKGGEISFVLLALLLLIFIGVFNYEQFFVVHKAAAELSAATHQRVFAVILSIVLAVLLVMFYFKSNFNFDPKAARLKVLAKIWVVLNVVLVLSAMMKNLEYIIDFGMTYKRLGVCAFLCLCLVGLWLTYHKISAQKTNDYLLNQMSRWFYVTLLLAGIFNWGAYATRYNVWAKKGTLSELRMLNYNHKILENRFHLRASDFYEPQMEVRGSILSKVGYYENLRHRWDTQKN